MADGAQLTELGALVRGAVGSGGGAGSQADSVAVPAILALTKLVLFGSPARALQVARADGVAAGLEECLRGSGSGGASATDAAAWLVRYVAAHEDAGRALLRGAPELLALSLARLAACAPRAAALEAGISGGGGGGGGAPRSASLCSALLAVLSKFLDGTLSRPERGSREAAEFARGVPVLVALIAHPEASIARAAAVGVSTAAIKIPAAAAVLFRCGGRGVLRAAEALLARVGHEMVRGARGEALHLAMSEAWSVAALINAACEAVVSNKPQLLTTPHADPWAAAAPRLAPGLTAADALLARAEPTAEGGFPSWTGRMPQMDLRIAAGALKLVAAWVPRARRISETAQSGGAAGPAGGFGGGGHHSGDGSGEAAAPRRCCAACGLTPADGARLHRCRGCGAFTGVMYCGNACAREHWVRRGHRKVCEPASAQVKAFKLEGAELFRLEEPER